MLYALTDNRIRYVHDPHTSHRLVCNGYGIGWIILAWDELQRGGEVMAARAKIAQKSAQQLANEVFAAKSLRDTLAKITADEDAVRDTIEGETNLHEAISAVMELIRDDEILVSGIERMQETLSARKARIKDRIAFFRSAVEQALVIGEIQTLELPDATLTVRRVAPGLEVVEESKIPAGFWKSQDPVLDRKALVDALKAGQEIPGAMLGNGGITLSVRRA